MNECNCFLLVGILFLASCGGDGNGSSNDESLMDSLNNAFSDIENYERDDFTVGNEEVEYWAVMVNETEISEDPSTGVVYGFNEEDYSSLSESRKDEIDSTFVSTGFSREGCEPEHCPLYTVVSTAEGGVETVDSDGQLVEFFDSIDTEAELHLYLWAKSYEPMSFESVDGGYRVLADLKTCENVTSRLLFVDHNGVITVEDEVEKDDEDPLACP